MATITDSLKTIFTTSGIQSVVFAMAAAENATDKLAIAEARLTKAQANAYYGSGTMQAVDAAQRRLNIAQRRGAEASFTEAAASAQPYIHALTKIVSLLQNAVDSAAKFGAEVMDLKAISGGSGTDAAGILNLFSAAGEGKGGASAIAGLNRKVFSGEGQSALMQLGISPRQGESSIQLFDQIADRLSKMSDGWYKMRIEQQLGVEGMQGLLRMSGETRKAILGFSDSMSGPALQTIQRFNEATGLLGVGIQSGIIQPIGVDLMTVLTPAIDLINDLISAWHRFDNALGGAGTWVVTIVALVGGFALAAVAVYKLIEAVKALGIAEKALILIQAVLDALEGPAGWAAIAVAIGVGGAALIGGTMSGGGGDPAAKVDKFGNAVDNFGDIVGQMRDLWGQGGQPKNLSANDAAHLMRMNAMGAIG